MLSYVLTDNHLINIVEIIISAIIFFRGVNLFIVIERAQITDTCQFDTSLKCTRYICKNDLLKLTGSAILLAFMFFIAEIRWIYGGIDKTVPSLDEYVWSFIEMGYLILVCAFIHFVSKAFNHRDCVIFKFIRKCLKKSN